MKTDSWSEIPGIVLTLCILVSKKYESEEPVELKVENNCEHVWTKIKVRGSKDIYVGSFYRPPNNIDAEYLGTLESYSIFSLDLLMFHCW
jgi:hypothetical protein